MLRIIKFLLTGKWKICEHKYKKITKTERYIPGESEFTYTYNSRIPYNIIVTESLVCIKCGDTKKVKNESYRI